MMFGAIFSLWWREVIRFYRQRSRVIGALASPLIFWFLIGSGVGNSFGTGDESYLEYFFPGALLLVLFFAAVFSTISIIEDRKEGFLQAVLVAPVPRIAIVLGKVLGSATLASFQGFLFLILTFWMGLSLEPLMILYIILAIFLNALLLSAMGFLMAWQFSSVQGFHAVMNIVLMPMWFLSGALFPAEGAASWIRVVMKANPLTYGLELLRGGFTSSPYFQSPQDFAVTLGMVIGFVLILLIAAAFLAHKNKVS